MKNLLITIIVLRLAVCHAGAAESASEAITPIPLKFGAVKQVFASTNGSRGPIEVAKKRFMPQEFVLNGIKHLKSGTIWCKQGPQGSYTNPFRENAVPLEKLETLQHASVKELEELLGQPQLMESAVDYQGTAVCQWRVCNGKKGDEFQAIEVTTGFMPKQQENVLFLLVRVAGGGKEQP